MSKQSLRRQDQPGWTWTFPLRTLQYLGNLPASTIRPSDSQIFLGSVLLSPLSSFQQNPWELLSIHIHLAVERHPNFKAYKEKTKECHGKPWINQVNWLELWARKILPKPRFLNYPNSQQRWWWSLKSGRKQVSPKPDFHSFGAPGSYLWPQNS